MNASWVKSSFSFANGNCVEVAELPGGSVGIRDSRDPGGPVLRFTRAEWAAFLGGARRGELERSHAKRAGARAHRHLVERAWPRIWHTGPARSAR
jgi:hypothetical protein